MVSHIPTLGLGELDSNGEARRVAGGVRPSCHETRFFWRHRCLLIGTMVRSGAPNEHLYLRTKRGRLGHLLTDLDAEAAPMAVAATPTDRATP
jgi:hypothetical protein